MSWKGTCIAIRLTHTLSLLLRHILHEGLSSTHAAKDVWRSKHVVRILLLLLRLLLGLLLRLALSKNWYSASRASLLMFKPFSETTKMENVTAREFFALIHVFATDYA